MLQGLGFKNKKAAAFGSYGWSGESVKILEEKLKGLARPGRRWTTGTMEPRERWH